MKPAFFISFFFLLFFSPRSAAGDMELQDFEMESQRYPAFFQDEKLALTLRRPIFVSEPLREPSPPFLYPTDLSFLPSDLPGLGIKLSPKLDYRSNTPPMAEGLAQAARLIHLLGSGVLRIQ